MGSITYFTNTRWCSHYSTACANMKINKHAVAFRLSADSAAPSTTATPALTTPTGTDPWGEAGSKSQCDTGAGEEYLANSPGKVSSLDECKELCQGEAACRSITYFTNTRWCSHYSTACTNTKKNNKAVSFRLSAELHVPSTTATPALTTPIGSNPWVEAGSKSQCDT